ncbi:uncharacterized protein LOC128330471 isoform X2 [Hemicordylus capensis]|uniref:uncharacterized protein LOC128330471 isoform X2 n=1 Tax=Hemicordylus capensis TaxID=884348 RepID=UPI002302A1FD|nr:uncharacterized protein LOC128330471 isoform X2 [Hemicordylus capensis]
MEALERVKKAPPQKDADPLGPPPKHRSRTRGAAQAELLKSMSDGLASLEKGEVMLRPVPLLLSGPDTQLPAAPSPTELPSPLPAVPVSAEPLPAGQLAPTRTGGPQKDARSRASKVCHHLLDSFTRLCAGGAVAHVCVLICGHSLVFWAYKQASTSPISTQLSLGRCANVRWLGMRGMPWSQLLLKLWAELASRSPPEVIVIHLVIPAQFQGVPRLVGAGQRAGTAHSSSGSLASSAFSILAGFPSSLP